MKLNVLKHDKKNTILLWMNGFILKSQNSPFEWLKHALLLCSIMQGQNNFQVHRGVLDETTYPLG